MTVTVTERAYEGIATGTTGITDAQIWIEGHDFHYIDDTGAERAITGDLSGATGLTRTGYIWAEGYDLHYIDADGDERLCVMCGVYTGFPYTFCFWFDGEA